MQHLEIMDTHKQGCFNKDASNRKKKLRTSVSVCLPDVEKSAYHGVISSDVKRNGPQKRKAFSQCMICSKQFQRRSSLWTHKRRHHGYTPGHNYRCPHCPVTVKTACHLALHKAIHAPGFSKCPVCGLKISSVERGRIHMKTHYNRTTRPGKCAVCGRQFQMECILRRHQITHINIRKYKCRVCGCLFKIARQLRRHKLTHSGKWKFHCNICGFGCQTEFRLEKHKKIVHNQCSKLYCKLCGMQARTRELLTSHVLKHSMGHRSYRVACPLCKVLFRTNIHLSMHLYRQHSDKCNVCEICLETFATLGSLMKHAKEQHSVLEKKCNLCNESIVDIYQCNKKHLAEKHFGCFKCFSCSRVYFHASLYRIHLKSRHPDRMMQFCELCGEHFETIESLNKHSLFCNKVRDLCDIPRPPRPPERSKPVHDEPIEAPEIKCISCSTKFSNLHDLQTHLLSGCPATPLLSGCLATPLLSGFPATPTSCEQGMTLESNSIVGPEQIESNKNVPSTTQNSEASITDNDPGAKPVKKKKIIPTATCNICNITFRNKLRLSRHMWRSHTEQWKESKDALQLDMSISRPQVPAQKDSENDDSLSDEKTNDKGKNQKNFKCFACGKEYWKSLALEMHIERRHCRNSPQPPPEENINHQVENNCVQESYRVEPESHVEPEKTIKESLSEQRIQHLHFQNTLTLRKQRTIEALRKQRTIEAQHELFDRRKEHWLQRLMPESTDETSQADTQIIKDNPDKTPCVGESKADNSQFVQRTCKTVKDQLIMRKGGLLSNSEESDNEQRVYCKTVKDQLAYMRKERLLPKSVAEASPAISTEENPKAGKNSPKRQSMPQLPLLPKPVADASPILTPTININQPFQVVLAPGVQPNFLSVLVANSPQILPGTPNFSPTVISKKSPDPCHDVSQPGVEPQLNNTSSTTSIIDTNILNHHCVPSHQHSLLPAQSTQTNYSSPCSLNASDQADKIDRLSGADSDAVDGTPLDLSCKPVKPLGDNARIPLKITDIRSFIDLTEIDDQAFPNHEPNKNEPNKTVLNARTALSQALIKGRADTTSRSIEDSFNPLHRETNMEIASSNNLVTARKALSNALSQPQLRSNVMRGPAGNGRLVVDCFICDKVFVRINDLLDHLRNQHN